MSHVIVAGYVHAMHIKGREGHNSSGLLLSLQQHGIGQI